MTKNINAKYDEIQKLNTSMQEVPDYGQTCISTTWVFYSKEEKVRARLVA